MRIGSILSNALSPRVLRAAIATAFLLSLGGAGAQAASGRLRFESGGQARSAFVIERERLKRQPRPTLIILQSTGGAVLRTRRNLGFEEAIRSQGVAIVYPDAADGRWDLTGPRDVQALRDLIRKLVDQRIADRRRVYLLGVSTGGMLALRAACEHAEGFAGVGSLIGPLPQSAAASCKPSRPVPIILLAGTADPFVPFNGGQANLRDFKEPVLSAEATLGPFKAADGCGDVAAPTTFADRDPHDNSRVTLETFKGCKAPVELVRVDGGGHSVPGRGRGTDRDPTGPHNNDVDGARLIWEFFKRAGA